MDGHLEVMALESCIRKHDVGHYVSVASFRGIRRAMTASGVTSWVFSVSREGVAQ